MGLATSRQEAFWEACGFGHIAKAKYLLEAGDIDVNWVSYTNDCCPIHTASQGKKEIVELLLQHNCDVNVRDNRGNLALHHAAMKGHVDIVEMLLEAGSEIDTQEKNGWTALHNAAYWCVPEVVKMLIKRGCNVHLQNKDERTALHECARSRQKDDQKLAEIARMLIEAGSDINAKSSDFGDADLTGLMYAAYHNHPEVACVLTEAGCELDCVGITFWTALHWAADRDNEEIVYILLDAGANPTIKCLKGETAYDRTSSEAIKETLATAMQIHKELHRISITQTLPILTRAKPETYKPMCDANFKSQSFLPGNWKPTSNTDMKNLINEKKARLAAMTKQQYRNELARRTGSSTIITDAHLPKENKQADPIKMNDKETNDNTNKEDSDITKENEANDGNEETNRSTVPNTNNDSETETEKHTYQKTEGEGSDVKECDKQQEELSEENDVVESKEIEISGSIETNDSLANEDVTEEESAILESEFLSGCDINDKNETGKELDNNQVSENSEIPTNSDCSTAACEENIHEGDSKTENSEVSSKINACTDKEET